MPAYLEFKPQFNSIPSPCCTYSASELTMCKDKFDNNVPDQSVHFLEGFNIRNLRGFTRRNFVLTTNAKHRLYKTTLMIGHKSNIFSFNQSKSTFLKEAKFAPKTIFCERTSG